jgi:thymidylate synthase
LGNVHIYENNISETRVLLSGESAKFSLNVWNSDSFLLNKL